jgi:hypothetical protein
VSKRNSYIAITRLGAQKIMSPDFSNPVEILHHMGAMQSQDFQMAKWAIGCRLLNPSEKKVEDSFNNAEILRTHLMRPTWHFVAAEDIYWMLDLTSPQIKSAMNARHDHLEISKTLLIKSFSIIEQLLLKQGEITREDLTKEFHHAKIRTDDNRLAHLLLCAELEGLVCSGPVKNNKPTYALLEERVPQKKVLARDEALAELAKRYFMSHGPATVSDFVWWSGLGVKDAKTALASVKSELVSESIGAQTYWMANFMEGRSLAKNSLFLLPAYDEFLISYRDRSASLSLTHFGKAVSSNGIFRPLIVVNGQVTGLWRKLTKGDKIVIETDFFLPPGKLVKKLLEKEVYRLGQFLRQETILKPEA